MIRSPLAALAAVASLPACAAAAQDMPGMTMPSHAQPTPPAKPANPPAAAPMPGMAMPAAPAAAAPPMQGMSMPAMAGMKMGQMKMGQMKMGLGGPDWQQGSGTARIPAGEPTMTGLMIPFGDWMLMAHGYAWGVLTHQAGPRGDDGHFVTSMAMLMADRDVSDRVHVQLRGMMSLDPALGPRGYPDLFATGEVAHGVPLIDRQHPHDLFMELSARADYRVGYATTLFLYGGPVAEPALGPSAFMHRASASLLPLAPITHHWFDSTHITYGVVTGGVSAATFQVELSGFKGREPDEHRWDFDTPAIDSWSARATWTPTPDWALQVSHGYLHSPEVQSPLQDEARTTASIQYSHRSGEHGDRGIATTFGYGLKDIRPGRKLSAWLAEANWDMDRHHSVFGRLENVANDELFPDRADLRHDTKYRVTKAEAGYAYRLPITGPLNVALGGTLAGYAKPAALDSAYGTGLVSWTLFAKLSLGR